MRIARVVYCRACLIGEGFFLGGAETLLDLIMLLFEKVGVEIVAICECDYLWGFRPSAQIADSPVLSANKVL